MQDFPHRYTVSAIGEAQGDVELAATRLPRMTSASPPEFDGPGDRWSPETLLVGAIGDCLILTFRAVARASKVPWTTLRCEVTGTLERVDRVTQFTGFDVHAHLDVPAGTDLDYARRALEKAEHNCLVTNSLKGAVHLVPDVSVAAESAAALMSA